MRKLTKQYKTAVIILSIAIILSVFILNIHNITNLPKTIQNWYEEYKYEKMVDQLWEEKTKPIKEAAKAAEEYAKKEEELKKYYTNLLKKDYYGGKTPEETLALFIESLKNKDYKLAAKYYVPWKWEEMEKRMNLLVSKEDRLNKFINSYYKGIIKKENILLNTYHIYIYDNKNDKYPYVLEIIKNEKTGVWKIKEF